MHPAKAAWDEFFWHTEGRRRAALWILMSQEDAHVLDGSNKAILDLLSPQPPPARTFEVMVVGGIGKAAFH